MLSTRLTETSPKVRTSIPHHPIVIHCPDKPVLVSTAQDKPSVLNSMTRHSFLVLPEGRVLLLGKARAVAIC